MRQPGGDMAQPTRDVRLQHLRQADADVRRAAALRRNARQEAARWGLDPGDDGREIAAWAQERAAAERRTTALRQLGMPALIVRRENGRYGVEGTGGRMNPFGRERLVFRQQDAQGRLHGDDGPAAVTDRGTLLFLRAGRFVPGPEGFCVITADGWGYRGAAQAAGRYGRLVARAASRAGRTSASRDVEPEL